MNASAHYPLVSLSWLNFNSMHVFDVTKQSLAALAALDYPNLEIVIVDVGSTDGSKEEIQKILQTNLFHRHKVVFVSLAEDIGPVGGANAAFKARNKQTKYVALTHSDVLPKPNYLQVLVSYLEKHMDVGAVQGIVTRLDGSLDSTGFMLDEALNLYSIHENTHFSLTKPLTLSYVEATMAMYRVEAIEKSKEDPDLFPPGAFSSYLEDVFLSLLLWSRGYKSLLLPVVTGRHRRGSTIHTYVSSLRQFYLRVRNQTALLYMTNSADKLHFILQNLRRTVVTRGSFTYRKTLLRSLLEGLMIGRVLRKKYGCINLYKAPLKKTSLKNRLHP